MKLEHFSYLLEIHRLHSISAASRKLHVGQTTLSAIVKVAEEEAGFQIFQRTPEGVLTTSAGEKFMAFAWEINIQYEKLMALKRRTTAGAPAITLLMAPTVSVRLTMPLLEQFYRFDLPGGLSIEECFSEDIPDYIINRRANIGLLYLSGDSIRRLTEGAGNPILSIEVLLEDQLYLLVSADHPLAGLKEIDVRSIHLERLATIKLMRHDMILGSLPSLCPSVTSFSEVGAMYQAIREQGMVGFIPGFSTSGDMAGEMEGLSRISLKHTEHPNQLYLCLVTGSNRKLKHQEETLKTCIRRYFRGIHSRKEGFQEETEHHEDRTTEISH